MRTTTCTDRVCHLQQFSLVVAAYITLQAIESLTVSITGLTRAHSKGRAYQDVKEPRYIIAKNTTSVFMKNNTFIKTLNVNIFS